MLYAAVRSSAPAASPQATRIAVEIDGSARPATTPSTTSSACGPSAAETPTIAISAAGCTTPQTAFSVASPWRSIRRPWIGRATPAPIASVPATTPASATEPVCSRTTSTIAIAPAPWVSCATRPETA